ncbi:MAG: hypothetical protein V8Q35_03585, partial [Alistipes finegoldii]
MCRSTLRRRASAARPCVVMRGAKSLYKDNNALYVIDGIPMSNVSFGSNDDGLQGNYMGSDGV